MRRFYATREFFIPKGSLKVADKASDAVAYVYQSESGKFYAAIFYGKQAKPVAHYRYRSVAEREASVKRHFEGRRAALAAKEQRKEAGKSEAEKFAQAIEVGDIFYTSWGYDQTNIDYYEITSVSGQTVTVRKVAMSSEDLGYDWRYKCVPQSGQFIGEATRHRIQAGYLKIDGHYAHKWNTNRVAGVPVGRALQGGGCH